MILTYNTIIVLVGVSLLGACAGVVGTFAVLRGRALTGDALAHAALPGLCVAVMLIGGRDLSAMLIGGFISGLLGVGVIAFLRRYTKVKEDAAVGVVLSVFFGAGIVLSTIIQQGANASAGIDSFIFGKTAGITLTDVLQLGGTALVCILIVVALLEPFRLICFDPEFAIVQGWPVLWLDTLLMGLIAITVIIGLPAVGVVMIAALLILPGATARLWSDRLGTILLLAAFFGMWTGIIGTLISANYPKMPTGPVIVLCGAIWFTFSTIFAPRRGWLATRRRRSP